MQPNNNVYSDFEPIEKAMKWQHRHTQKMYDLYWETGDEAFYTLYHISKDKEKELEAERLRGVELVPLF
jgi:hypothetical protein